MPPLNWKKVSPFTQKVLKTLYNNTKFGEVISYQELAKIIGNAKYARAIGQALNKNPWPILIPCHRVINKNKKIGGFSAGIPLKKILLLHEGIKI